MKSFTWGMDSQGSECGSCPPDPPDYKTSLSSVWSNRVDPGLREK